MPTSPLTLLDRRVPLCSAPSPVRPLQALRAGLWLKDDGHLHPLYGGNKVRKLEFLLHQVPDTLWTVGASGSNHVLATVLHAQALGIQVHALAVPRPRAPLPELSLRITLDRAASVTLHRDLSSVRSALSAVDPKAIVPAGGSSRWGSLGFVRAGLELGEQVREGLLPEPRFIFIPLGTAGSALGLALGCSLAGLSSEVIGVRVVPTHWLPQKRIRRLASELGGLLGVDPPQIRVVDARLGPGYGLPGPGSLEALGMAHRQGLLIEGTYGAKTLAEALAHDGGPDLFWSTLNQRPLLPLVAGSPQVGEGWFL